MAEEMRYADRIEQMRGLAEAWSRLDETNPLRAVGEIWMASLARVAHLEAELRYVRDECVPLMESHARTVALDRIERALDPTESAAPRASATLAANAGLAYGSEPLPKGAPERDPPGEAGTDRVKCAALWPAGRQVLVANAGWRARLHGAIEVLRKAWRNDGAEGESVHLVCNAAEALLTARDEAMRALARHDGRSWCAVCGFDIVDCGKRSPNCLGAIARREFLGGKT